jgi:hypothetical protein
MLAGALAGGADSVNTGIITDSAAITAVAATLLSGQMTAVAEESGTPLSATLALISAGESAIAAEYGGVTAVTPQLLTATTSRVAEESGTVVPISPSPLTAAGTGLASGAFVIGVAADPLTATVEAPSVTEQGQITGVVATMLTAWGPNLTPKQRKQRVTPAIGEGVAVPAIGAAEVAPKPSSIKE